MEQKLVVQVLILLMQEKYHVKKLGIKHYILNFENNFKEFVINDFVESYVNGQTPIPCISAIKQLNSQI